MKLLKRILNAMVSIVLVSCFLCPADIIAAEDAQTNEEYLETIIGMNILDGIEYTEPGQDMKVSDFITAIRNATDIDAEYILSGYTVGEYIRCSEAAKVFIDMLGYPQMNKDMVYPSDYLTMAAEKGLLDGIDINGAQVITIREFCLMMWNAFDIPAVIAGNMGPNGPESYSIDDDRTFLTEIMRISEIDGQITANNITSLGVQTAALECLYIGNEQYLLPDRLSHWNKRVGYFVTAYVRRNGVDEQEIIYMKLDDRSDITDISGDDVISYSNYTLTYYRDSTGSRRDTQALPRDIDVIYNGIRASEYTEEMFKPENGTVSIIFEPNSNVPAAVNILSYVDCVISGIDYTNYCVYNKIAPDYSDNKKFEFNMDDERQTVHFYTEDGSETTFDALKEGDVLSIAQSGVYADVYVSDNILRNTEIAEMFSDSDGTAVRTSTGEEYRLSNAFMASEEYDMLSVGVTYNISLNVFGQIASISRYGSTDRIAGYFMRMYYDENEDFARIKLFQKDGTFGQYDLADQVTLYDMYGGSKNYKNDAGGVYDVLREYTGLIWLTLNGEGEIYKIELALRKYNSSYPERTYIIEPESLNDDIYEYKHEYRTWGYHYYMSSGVTVYSVPDADNRDNEELYRIVNIATLEYDNNISDAEQIYSDDPDGVMITDIIRTTEPQAIETRADLIVVTDVMEAVGYDGAICKRIVGMVDGNKVVYDAPIGSGGLSAFDRATDLAHEGSDNPTEYRVQVGDFIRVGCEFRSGLVYDVQLVYRRDIENPMFPNGEKGFLVGSEYLQNDLGYQVINPIGLDYQGNTIEMTKSINAGSYRVYLGWVYKKNGSIITLTTQDPSSGSLDMASPDYFTESYNISSFGRYTTVDYDDGTVEQGNADDVRAYKDCGDSCSRVIVTRYYGELNQIILINGEYNPDI